MLGIDPGTNVTGFGVVEGLNGHPGRLIECGVIRTNPKQKIWYRLDTLFDGVTELIERHRPSAVALESVFYAKNVKTTVALGRASAVILLAAARAGLDVAEYAPATVKKSVVGSGRAAKAQVAYMVQRLLNLKTPPRPADAADGVAIALTYIVNRGRGR